MRTVLRWVIGVIVVLHGLIHLMGVVKGFGWAEVNQLKEPISATAGAGWLIATVLVVAAGVMLCFSIRDWWIVGGIAAVVSQAIIFTSWSDAKAGSVANVVLLVAVVYGGASQGPTSHRSKYRRRVNRALSDQNDHKDAGLVTDTDLASLPEPVAAYLRRCGAVGQPRVSNFRAVVHGRIRSGPTKPWMTFTGEQVNTYGDHPSRLFLMDATRAGLPVDVFHSFVGSSATMTVKLCSLFPIVRASGPDLDRAETVTLFNDLCVLAPAALLGARVSWESIDAHRVRGRFTNGAHNVSADLVFDDRNDLVDFISDDRLRASEDGKSFRQQRWSTPITAYREFGKRRVGVVGEGHWHAPDPEGEFTYIEFSIDKIEYNVGTGTAFRREPVVVDDIDRQRGRIGSPA
jgi:hypothetical protein